MKDTLIWCKTKKQLEDVVSKLSEDGYSVSTVDYMWDSYGKETTLRLNGKSVTYCPRDWYEKNGYGTPITAREFLGNKVSNIVIFRRDRNVIAKDVATGKKGVAKCSPTDEFNFHTGASIALARLMSKVPATGVLNPDVRAEWTKLLGITETPAKVYPDADRNFKVGDRVVVRDWDDMEKEYGASDDGYIDKGSKFVERMKRFCGCTGTITAVGDDLPEGRVSVEFDDKSKTALWTFNPWMFNPTDVPAPEKEKPEAKFKVGDYVTLKEDVEADKRYGGLWLHLGAMYDNAHNQRMTVVRVNWSNDSGTYYYECKGDGKYAFYYSDEMLDKCGESKIHEGDTVKVFNAGLSYTTYPQWVGKHISDPDMAARYCFATPNTYEEYKVIKIAKHEFEGVDLAYIEQCNGFGYKNCYLIDVEGLVKA